MDKMKRILSTLLALLLVVSLASPGAWAAGTPTVSITSGEVKPGDTVTLTVSIKDNPGLAACMLYIYYDTSVFEVNPGSGLRASGSFRSDGGLIGNSIELAKKNGRYNGEAGKDGVLALWYNGSGVNTTEDGGMMTITLTAKATAANGDYAVSVGYSGDDTCNEKGGEVALTTESGTITVSGGSTDKPAESQKPEETEKPADKPAGTVEKVTFTDISGSWAEEYILRANASGLVEGYGAGKYGPNEQMTRAQFVTILWRASGEAKPTKSASFKDLDPKQSWYHTAVAWAEENQVVNGVGNGKFDPNGRVTREQIATILHRLAGTPKGMELMLGGIYEDMFPDSGKISSWAKDALYWTLSEGIYCGEKSVDLVEGDVLAPGEAADRAQIAVMMIRYLDNQGGNT